MAVVSVKLQKERGSNKDGAYSCTREYLVAFDVPNAGVFAAIAAEAPGGTRIPLYGSSHPSIGLIRVSSIDAELAGDSLRHYKVTVEYSQKEQIDKPDNPLEREPEISWSYAEASEPFFRDRSNPPKPVTNSAGDPFENYLEKESGVLTCTVVRNELEYNPAALDEYSHAVNLNYVTIDGIRFDPGTLKISPITAVKTKETYNDADGVPVTVTFYKRTYVFKAKHEGWDNKVLDIGLNEKVGDEVKGFQIKPILDKINKPVSKPWPLDGEGKRKPNPTDEAAELTFKPYEHKNFAGIGWA